MPLRNLVLVFLAAKLSTAFNFRQPDIYVDNQVIGETAQYIFQLTRSQDNSGVQTDWQTNTVTATDDIVVTFPSEYDVSSTSCSSVIVNTQSVSGYTSTANVSSVTITGAFTTITNLSIAVVNVTIQNVINPVPAQKMMNFIGIIGSDRSVSDDGGIDLKTAIFQNCEITFNPNTVNTTSAMVLTLDPKNALDASSKISIKLPKFLVWTNNMNQQDQFSLSSTMVCNNLTADLETPTCSGNRTTAIISVSSLFTTSISTSFTFEIVGLKSPPTPQEIDPILITSYINDHAVDTCTPYVTGLVAKPLQSLIIDSFSTLTVNSEVGIKFTFGLSDYMDNDDEMKITFPDGLQINMISVTGTLSIQPPLQSGKIITIKQKSSQGLSEPGNPQTINFMKIITPPSTKTTDPIKFQITRNGYPKMEGTVTLTAVAASLSGTAEIVSGVVWAISQYKMNLTISDPLTSAGIVEIQFPDTIEPTTTTNCASLIGQGVKNSPTCSYDSSSRTMTISDMSASSDDIQAQTLQIIINGVRNAPSIKPSDPFPTRTYYTADTTTGLVAQGDISGVTAQVGTIDSSTISVIASSYIVLDKAVTYTISFTNTYLIPQGGYIQLTIPVEIEVDFSNIRSNCQRELNGGGFQGTTCTDVSRTVSWPDIAVSGDIAAGSSISLKIDSVFTNPASTETVNTFTITTFHSDGFKIQQRLDGITIQMTTPAPMQSMGVTRNSNTNSDPNAQYTIRLQQQPPMQASSVLSITFPDVIKLSASIACTDLSGNALTCSYSASPTYVLKVTLGSSSIPSQQQFGVIVSGVVNPPSFAPLASDFSYLTQSASQSFSYATGSHTPDLSNSVASSFQSITGTFLTRIYGEATNLQIDLTPSGSTVPSTLKITIASRFIVSNLECTTNPFNIISSHTIEVTGITTSAAMMVALSGLTAPKSEFSDYTFVSSYDSGGYQIDKSTTDIIFTANCTLPCRTCSETKTSCLSCYTDPGISLKKYLHEDNSQCYEICPASTYSSDTPSFKCLNCQSKCQECSLTADNCTKCDPTGTYKYLNETGDDGDCLADCPEKFYADTSQSPVLCVECLSPCETCNSSTQCQSCVDGRFYHDGICQSSCPSGTTIQNSATNNCDKCNIECAQCQVTVDNCTSCATDAALHNGECKSVCPDPLVIYNGVCANCSNECGTCSIQYDNCTSCKDESQSVFNYLHDNECLETCPTTYYEDVGTCKLCADLSIGCTNCKSSSTCITCDPGLVFLSENCYSSTPNGHYNDSGIARQCSSIDNCATCQGTAQNCLSCSNNKFLDGNDCLDSCPTVKVNVNSTCVPCDSPCYECSIIASNCTSCLSNQSPKVYLSNYKCVQDCPDQTYENNITNECTRCESPCELCESSTRCITCLQSFYLREDGITCNQTCPDGFFGESRQCKPCTSNCRTCSGSVSSCESCTSGYYLVSSNNSCSSSCPTDLYPNPEWGNCTGCLDPCDTCQNTSTSCLSCKTGYLFGNKCEVNCPDGSYGVNTQCLSCPVGCEKCSSSAFCSQCVYPGYFLHNNYCIDSCPDSHPINSTRQCQKCTDTNCLQCDFEDKCKECNYPTVMYLETCLDQCPENYSSNGTDCQYNEPLPVEQELNETLTSSDIFPVPFTIASAFIGIACMMSKFQHRYTFLFGALYSLFSLLEWGSWGMALFMYFSRVSTSFTLANEYLEGLIFVSAIAFFYLLNILALFIQNCFLRGDADFVRWQKKQAANFGWYTGVSIVGLLITHKFKNIMFCRLFGFEIFKARLETLQNFRVFNVFAFLSFIPSAAILFATSFLIIAVHTTINQQFIAYIDAMVMTFICVILAILASRKDPNFFEQKDDDGLVMHKRITASQSLLQVGIAPQAEEQGQKIGNNFNKAFFQTERVLKSFNEDNPVTEISIQAGPVLEEYSQIDFVEDGDISEFSMIRKVGAGKVPDTKHESNIFESEKRDKSANRQLGHTNSLRSSKPVFQNFSREDLQSEQGQKSQPGDLNEEEKSEQKAVKHEQGLEEEEIDEIVMNDASSFVNPNDGDFIVNFNKAQLKSDENESPSGNNKKRINTQNTEKQLINILQNHSNQQDELSFNVTDDLENSQQANKLKVHIQENDKKMDSDDDEIIFGDTKEKKPETNVLGNGHWQEIPIQSGISRLAHVHSAERNRNRPPRAPFHNSWEQENGISDSEQLEDDDPIVNGPMGYKKKNSSGQYQQKNRNYHPRTRNLNESADEPIQREIGITRDHQQQPLPELKRLYSEESNQSQENKQYQRKPKETIQEGAKLKLEFNRNQRYLDTQSSQQMPKRSLARAHMSEKKLYKDRSGQRMQRPVARQILGRDKQVYDRTSEYLEKQQKRTENRKKQFEEMQAMLQVPKIHNSSEKNYLKSTNSFNDKKQRSSLEKVYKNKHANRR